MANFQYHLIGRCDDTAHVRKRFLMPSSEFPGYLTTKICWSKNVHDESNCPEQILLPCWTSEMCPYLSLALFLEQWLQYGNGTRSPWLFCKRRTTASSPTSEQNAETIRGKDLYARALKRAINSDSFVRSTPGGKLGSHSIRKLACTEARQRGVPKDDIDYRARWKVKRMQDRYTEIQLTWPDVHCASRLSQGGVIQYVIHSDLGLTDEWLCQYVTPRISSCFGLQVGAILAKPLLWSCFNLEYSEQVHPDLKHRIISSCIRRDIRNDDSTYNPVSRVEVVASECKKTNTICLKLRLPDANKIYTLTKFMFTATGNNKRLIATSIHTQRTKRWRHC